MTKEKLTYVSPETETLVVRFEGVVCASTGNNSINNWENGDDVPVGF